MKTQYRAVWTGQLVFGLTTLPIKLHSANESSSISFTTLHECEPCDAVTHQPGRHTPIKQLKWCPSCGDDVEEVVKGYELEKGSGSYVIMTDDDFDSLKLISDKTLVIREFVPSVDPLHFDKNYYIQPPEQPQAAMVYGVLRDTMLETGVVAIGQFTFREREHLAAIWPTPLALVLTTLHYRDEVREVDFHCPGGSEASLRELMGQAVELLSRPCLDWSQYSNGRNEALRQLIASKLDGTDFVPTVKEPVPAGSVDMLENLRLSVAEFQRREKEALV